MKNKKRILTLVTALMLVFAVNGIAMAADTSNTSIPSSQDKLDQRITKLEQRQEKIDQKIQAVQDKASALAAKKDKMNVYRKDLIEKRVACLNNEGENLKLISQAVSLRLDYLNKLEAIKVNKTVLSADTKTQLKNDQSQCKDIMAALHATKGQIKAVLQQYQDSIKAKDTNAVDAAYQKISDIQNQRHQSLTQLVQVLQNIKDLLANV